MEIGDLIQVDPSIFAFKHQIGIVVNTRTWEDEPVVDVLMTSGRFRLDVIGFKEKNTVLLSASD